MAPYTSVGLHTADHSHKAQEIRKLRKPVIEKMRRDRINSSIEQLRMLLEKEFENHHLPSKPEKADILEMTVRFLQQHMAGQSKPSPSQAYSDGYSTCLQDTVHFLSLHKQTEVQEKLLQNVHGDHSTTNGLSYGSPYNQTPIKHTEQRANKLVWRPWN
ncbi:hypothetical protein GDO86_012555 [Hymenochirus boettgeri]|uniref:Transcription factor HES-5 n=1 Tax=Hymenochirus boettgeri TaxID=247094 RepID=A0A8T2IUU0_9PIPI|nr:hypothetical protein GDO86_012555 [Hymenochirus boettgeri]